MSLLDIARDTLKDLPVSDILRERLSLALDLAAEAEAKIDRLQSENGALKADLEREQRDHHQNKEQLQRLKEEHAEEIRIHSSVEFRRGKRTGGHWLPFCPVCHTPADLNLAVVSCGNGQCGWQTMLAANQIAGAIAQLGA